MGYEVLIITTRGLPKVTFLAEAEVEGGKKFGLWLNAKAESGK